MLTGVSHTSIQRSRSGRLTDEEIGVWMTSHLHGAIREVTRRTWIWRPMSIHHPPSQIVNLRVNSKFRQSIQFCWKNPSKTSRGGQTGWPLKWWQERRWTRKSEFKLSEVWQLVLLLCLAEQITCTAQLKFYSIKTVMATCSWFVRLFCPIPQLRNTRSTLFFSSQFQIFPSSSTILILL